MSTTYVKQTSGAASGNVDCFLRVQNCPMEKVTMIVIKVVSGMDKFIGLAEMITDIFLLICFGTYLFHQDAFCFLLLYMHKHKHLECFLFYIHVFEVSHLMFESHFYKKIFWNLYRRV